MSAFRSFCLAGSLVLVSTLATAPQARAATTPSAYVYIQIQGPEGAVYGFQSSSAGKLSTISGSPFKPAGQMVGSTATKFFTLGQDLIHSYGLSNGAIQAQLEQLPYTDYTGGACGSGSSGVRSAELDHTGKFIYVLLENGGDGSCAAYQSFQINNEGAFLSVGETEVNTSGGGFVGLPSILGNESFGYANFGSGHAAEVIGFQRASSGALGKVPFNETDPVPADGSFYTPRGPDASPTGNYVVLQLYPNDSGMGQLGVYSVDGKGNLSTTNTAATMPNSPFYISGTTFSPAGDMFVVYADNGPNPGLGNGIQIYKFNGAAPLTPYTTLLNGTPIDQVTWDKYNHLYAISRSTNKLYVFTVTATSVTQDTSWSIGSPFSMVVVSE